MGIDNTYINSDNRVDKGLRIRSTDSIIYFNNKKAKFFQQFLFVSWHNFVEFDNIICTGNFFLQQKNRAEPM